MSYLISTQSHIKETIHSQVHNNKMVYSLLAPQNTAFDRGLRKLALSRRDLRNIILEFIGTMIFTLFGSMGTSADAAIRNGLVLALVIYFTDGGHLNSWVSLSAFLTRNLRLNMFLGYVIAQVSGALVGAAWLYAVLPSTDGGPGTFRPNGITLGQVFAIEALGTFAFILLVQSVALRFTSFSNPDVDITAPNSFGGVGGLVIGFSLAAVAYAIGPFTGASVNLDRTIASAIVFRDIRAWTVGVYILGELTGTLIATLVAAVAFGIGTPIVAIVKPGPVSTNTPLLDSVQSHVWRGEPVVDPVHQRGVRNTPNAAQAV